MELADNNLTTDPLFSNIIQVTLSNCSERGALDSLVTSCQDPNDDSHPSHVASDYIEMSFLLLAFVVGVPLNTYSFVNTIRSLKQSTGRRARIFSFTRLRLHLNVADLLILCVHVPLKFIWLITYQWYGGDLACRALKFMSLFAFCLASNMVVCIAVDRTIQAFHLRQHRPGRKRTLLVRQMILASYLMAALFSCPQMALFKLVNPYKSSAFEQCSSVFRIWKKEKEMGLSVPFFAEYGPVYNTYHLFVVFWLPLLAVVVCYIVVILRLHLEVKRCHSQQCSDSVELQQLRHRHSHRVPHVTETPVLMGVQSSSVCNLTIAVREEQTVLKSQKISVVRLNSPPRDTIDCNMPKPLIDQSASITISPSQSTFQKFPSISPRHQSNRVTMTTVKSQNNTHRKLTRNNPKRKKSPNVIIGDLNQFNNNNKFNQSINGNASARSRSLFGPITKRFSIASTEPARNGRNRRVSRFYDSTLIVARKKMSRKAVIIFVTYVTLWSPYNVLSLYSVMLHPSEQIQHLDRFVHFLYNLIVISAIANPLIYGVTL